jgi:hypothetical protein
MPIVPSIISLNARIAALEGRVTNLENVIRDLRARMDEPKPSEGWRKTGYVSPTWEYVSPPKT